MSQIQTHVFSLAMTCEGCANAAKKVLKKHGEIEGDEFVTTDVEAKTVTVKTTKSADDILEILKKTNLEVSIKE